MGKSGLVLAKIILDYCQQKYALRLFTLFNNYLAKNIFFITLRIDDGNAQLKDLLEDNGI